MTTSLQSMPGERGDEQARPYDGPTHRTLPASIVPDYSTDSMKSLRARHADTLAHALGELSRERIGLQKDLAARMSVSCQYVNDLLSGRRTIYSDQLNRILDACGCSDEERATFNAWGAREAGWRI